MPDSTITKKALAQALKELIREMPIEKINVAFICQRCGMKRQSFYYHFRDKYHLINWIFDSEIGAVLRDSPDAAQEDPLDKFQQLCDYFYENRVFYRSALQVKGQDSFLVHFQRSVFSIFKHYFSFLPADGKCDEFTANFFADAIVCCIARWILSRNGMLPEEFTRNVKQLGAVIRFAEQRSSFPAESFDL